jgi:DNA-binding transcriptional regulator YhcF (GntR family)
MLWHIDHASPTSLREQLVAAVRGAIARGEVNVGDPLPPAAELAEVVDVDRNTVLAAYRQLRDAGVLEFRRGRGVRVARASRPAPAVVQAATALVDAARAHGVGRGDLIRLIEEMA